MINWKRIFGNEIEIERLYLDATLKRARQAIIEREWTDALSDIFDSILWRQETAMQFAARIEESVAVAIRMHDHGYRALKMMADEGWIKPIWL